MSMIEFEPTLWDGLLLLFKFLLGLIVVALGLAILTLPIFYLCLAAISKWTGARDGMDSTNPRAAGRLFNGVIWFGFPLLSVAGTAFLLAYSGAVDYAAAKAGVGLAIKKTLGNSFDEVTKKMSGKADILDAPDPEDGQLDEAKEKERSEAKMAVKGMRGGIVFFLYMAGPMPLLVMVSAAVAGRRNVTLIVRSLTRNPLRTSLSYIAIFVLSAVLICVWSILAFLDAVTAEKEGNLKAIISERYQIPSQMKPTHLATLKTLLEEMPPESRPKNGDLDIMTWAFVGGTLDPTNKTFQNSLFFFCMEPAKVTSMLDGLDDLTAEQRKLLDKGVQAMLDNKLGVVIGKDTLARLNKRVGDKIQLTSTNYKDLVFDLTIVGTFPEGTRYDQSAVMNRQALDDAIRSYGRTAGVAHPMADKCMNLIWIRLPDKKAFDILAEKVNTSGQFNPAIKIETSSSGIGTFLDPLKEIFWGLRWILVPVLVGTMTLVIANAISISVRERRTEMAVLKVLGYPPGTIAFFVLGEALFVGLLSGFISTCLISVMVNVASGGLALGIAFFGKFFIPNAALWWGPAVGGFAAAVGSILPARSARAVKVTDVFSKVA